MIDLDNKVNIKTLVSTAMLEFKVCSIAVKAQKINSLLLKISNIIIVNFIF